MVKTVSMFFSFLIPFLMWGGQLLLTVLGKLIGLLNNRELDKMM